MPGNWIQYAIGGAVFLLILALRMRGMARQRRLRIEQLWIVPAIFTAVAGFAIWQQPPHAADMPWLVGAAIIGAVIGWYRGKMMRITVDPETHAINQSASPLAIIFLLGILAIRQGARFWLTEEAQAWHISLAVLTDAPLVLIVAMFITARIEMFLRATKLLNEARTARSNAPITGTPTS